MSDTGGEGWAAGMESLVLASASPRRAEILRAVGWRFVVRVAEVDETPHAGETPSFYVERLARAKAEAVARQAMGDASSEPHLVLGADTTVVVDDRILGKPRGEGEARSMLELLQGRWHEVLTGIALTDAKEGRTLVAHETTRVRFGRMTADEIAAYVATDEPMDKAGAYAVQGRAALFIERVDGDFWNVVGLPVRLVYRLARSFRGYTTLD